MAYFNDEINVDSTISPVWQLPVCGAERTGNSYISMRAKYHCFVDDISLCGKYHQDTSDYDHGITIESASIVEIPQNACKRCFELWKEKYNVEV